MATMNVELAKWACRDHFPAVMFLAHLEDIAHIADDIADGDMDSVGRAVEDLLAWALVTLPCDPFYRENFDRLQPLVANAVTHWATANAFERSGDPRMLDRAFILRSMYATLTVACAAIVAGPVDGPQWSREVATKLWAEWTHESVGDYISEHVTARVAPPPVVSERITAVDSGGST